MSVKKTLRSESASRDLWGGPLWRRIIVALAGLAVLGAWFFLTDRWFF